MAFNLQVFSRFSIRIDNTDLRGGSFEVPTTFDVDGEVFDRTYSIANAANSVVYNTSISTFNFIFIQSDEDARLLITDTNTNTFSIWTRGTGVTSRYGVPFILANDNTEGAYVVNTVQAFNTSGNTARIRVVAIK